MNLQRQLDSRHARCPKSGSPIVRVGIIVLASSVSSYAGPLTLTLSDPTASENFDDLKDSESAALPTGFKFSGAGKGSTLPYSNIDNRTTANRVGTGTDGAGGRYNFGDASQVLDRGIGFITTSNYLGTNGNAVFGLVTNGATRAITSLTVNYDVKRYRQDFTTATVDFGFNNSQTTSAFTTVGDARVQFDRGTPAGVRSPADRESRSVTFATPLLSTQNSTYVLRWLVDTGTSTSQGVGVDNVQVAANFESSHLTYKEGAWDNAVSPSFTRNGGGVTPTSFLKNDCVTFSNSAGGVVTIGGGGVQPASIAVSASDGVYHFSGQPISGASTLTKSGDGTLILSNNNTYTGVTTVNGGTLIANGNESGGSNRGKVVVNSGGRLAGAGTLNRIVEVNRGATITAGSLVDGPVAGTKVPTVGTLRTNGQTWTGGNGAKYEVKLQGSGSGFVNDQLIINGSLAIVATDGKFVIKLVSLKADGTTGTVTGLPNNGRTAFQIVSSGSPISPAMQAMFELDTTGMVTGNTQDGSTETYKLSFGSGAGTISVEYADSPEPATAVLCLLGGGVLLTRRPRGKKLAATSR